MVFIQDDSDIKSQIAFVNLPHWTSLIRAANRFQDIHGIKTPIGEIGGTQMEGKLRDSGTGLNAHVQGPRDFFENQDRLFALLIQDLKIVPKDIDNNRGGKTRKGFYNSFREKGIHLEGEIGKLVQDLPTLRFGFFGFFPLEWIEIDFQLA